MPLVGKHDAGNKALLSVAIDVDDASTEWNFSLMCDFECDPNTMYQSQFICTSGCKVTTSQPTVVLLQSDGTELHSTGYEAIDDYIELKGNGKHGSCLFFRTLECENDNSYQLRDVTNKSLNSDTIFTLYLKEIKREIFEKIDKSFQSDKTVYGRIQWVFTIPVDWNKATIRSLERSAKEIGISEKKLSFITKTEAAFLYCLYSNRKRNLYPSYRNLVLYCGDIGQRDAFRITKKITATAAVIQYNGKDRYSRKSSGSWTFESPVARFMSFLIDHLDDDVKKTLYDEHVHDVGDLLNILIRKCLSYTPDASDMVSIKIPLEILECVKDMTGESFVELLSKSCNADNISVIADQIRIHSVVQGILQDSVKNIVDHTSAFADDCDAIIMVGRFADSPMLQRAIAHAFPNIKLIVNPKYTNAALDGAAMHGHFIFKD